MNLGALDGEGWRRRTAPDLLQLLLLFAVRRAASSPLHTESKETAEDTLAQRLPTPWFLQLNLIHKIVVVVSDRITSCALLNWTRVLWNF